MKSFFITVLAVALLVGGVFWSKSPANNDPNIIAQGGIHWHPQLAIYVKGTQIHIPPNVGLGPQYAGVPGYDPQMRMAAVHTHDDVPLVHLEFAGGPVLKEDASLGAFFKIWGKDMRSFGSNMRMTVNGKENTEYENYVMRDGDILELNYD